MQGRDRVALVGIQPGLPSTTRQEGISISSFSRQSPHYELQGPGLRLLACGYGWQLRWWFNGRCSKPVGSKALTWPVLCHPSAFPESPCRRGNTRDGMPNPFLRARASLRAGHTYLQAFLSTQRATVPCHFSLELSMFPGCLYTTTLGALDQDGHRGLQDFTATKNRPQWSSVRSTRGWWERATAHGACNNYSTGEQATEQTGNQRLTELCRWKGISQGL